MNCWCMSVCVQVGFPLPRASCGVCVDERFAWLDAWMAAEQLQRFHVTGGRVWPERWELDLWPLGRGSIRQERLLGHQEGLWGVWRAKQLVVLSLLHLCLGNVSRSWNCRSGAALTAAVKSPAPLEQHFHMVLQRVGECEQGESTHSPSWHL